MNIAAGASEDSTQLRNGAGTATTRVAIAILLVVPLLLVFWRFRSGGTEDLDPLFPIQYSFLLLVGLCAVLRRGWARWLLGTLAILVAAGLLAGIVISILEQRPAEISWPHVLGSVIYGVCGWILLFSASGRSYFSRSSQPIECPGSVSPLK